MRQTKAMQARSESAKKGWETRQRKAAEEAKKTWKVVDDGSGLIKAMRLAGEASSPLSARLAGARQLDRAELGHHVARLISVERNATHGDPHRQFAFAQELKDLLHSEMDGLASETCQLGSTEQESLEMIATKISRLIHGSNLQDAWLDIAGYALIAAEHATKPLTVESQK